MEPLKINFVGNLPGASSADTVVLSTEADYCDVSSRLRDDLAAGYRSIWVREEHLYSWLRTQVEHWGISHQRSVEFARTTPALLLAERWGVKVPAWLTDDLILQEGLLDKELPAGCTDATTGLLAPLLGILPGAIQSRLIGSLSERLSDAVVETAMAKPLMTAAWQALLAQWSSAGHAVPWVESLCTRLAASPRALWRDLTAWRLLRGYPAAVLDFALEPIAAHFVRSLPADAIQGMALNSEGRQLALDQIEQIVDFSGLSIVTRPNFEKLVQAVSGELVEELTGLESMLEKAGFEVGVSDIAAIKQRFKTCEGLSTASLRRLSLYVRPAQPDHIENQGPDAAQWARWAQDQYLPYRWWQIQRRFADPDVEQSVAAFSKWYCRNFDLVHSDPAQSAVQTMTRWRESILGDKVSLVLLVDNLPWFFWDLFEKSLAGAGLHRHECKASFVPLPSHTSVCKPLLVSGQAGSSGSDYQKMLTARSAEEWQGRPAYYKMGVDQLASLPSTSEPYLVLLNYLAGDDALHADAEATGSSWSDQLGLLYGNLARAVGDFAKRAVGAGGDFGLYVLTDHGSTLILPEEKQAADAQLTKKLFPNEKYRSATLTAQEADQVPENIWKLGHRLTSLLGEGLHFIPSGHNTVAAPGNRPSFSHGGATPEEVIVPSGIFRLYSATWKPPGLRFADLDLKAGKATFYVKRIVSISVEIQNANGEECRLESVEISPEVAEIREFSAVIIPAKSSGQAKVSLYFGSSATTISVLSLALTFRIGQDSVVQTIELPVSITSATAGGIDLKDLL